MSIRGSCDCNNIQVAWFTVDHSLVPRACGCEYCRGNSAAWVSKSGTRFEVAIQRNEFHRVVRHGSQSAAFHECANCDELVFVTAEISGELYGALNASRLDNKFGFPDPIETDVSSLSAAQKRERWRRNWCCPVLIKSCGE